MQLLYLILALLGGAIMVTIANSILQVKYTSTFQQIAHTVVLGLYGFAIAVAVVSL